MTVFWGYTEISLSVCPSACVPVYPCDFVSVCFVYPCIYKILVILICKLLLQLCCFCIESLLIHWSHTEVVQDEVFNHLLLMVQGLSPLEFREFLSPWGPGFFLLYRIGPLPFSMACRKRRLKSDTNGCFPRNS